MDELFKQLKSIRQQHEEAFVPELLNLEDQDSRARLAGLLSDGSIANVCDTLDEQIIELFSLRFVDKKKRPSFSAFRLELLAGTNSDRFGTWCYFAWNKNLVHILPEPLFFEVRTNRNCYKISPQEQQTLAEKRVGIIGLSVGSAIAVTMAMEGVGGFFRLADFDNLSLSNLNRLNATVAELCVNKAILTARRMTEINPYLRIEIIKEGLRSGDIDSFLQNDGKLDLVVEECDDLDIKLAVRVKARACGVPVVMETSDRGLLDVERFDREPDRPIFHGLVDESRISHTATMTAQEKLPLIFQILDGSQLSTSAQASMLEIGQSISTWPQLASAVVMGGGTVTDVARRIFLNTFGDSGRFYIDIESLVKDRDHAGAPEAMQHDVKNLSMDTAEGLNCAAQLSDRPRQSSAATIGQDEYLWILQHAIQAPSGGNVQPWKFEYGSNRVLGYRDPSRRGPLLDFEYRATDVALGAAAENIELAARSLGLTTDWKYFPEGYESHCVFAASFERCDDLEEDPLFSQIAMRCTNRKLGTTQPLSEFHADQLKQEACCAGGTLSIISDQEELARVGRIIGETDRLRFLAQPLHQELIEELRWTEQETFRSRDGIDLATLELSAGDLAVMQLFRSWRTMERLKQVGGGAGIVQAAKDCISGSSAFCLLTLPAQGPESYVLGGRVLQRVWLKANALGLSIQPMSVLVYLMARVEAGACGGLSLGEQNRLLQMRVELKQLFGETRDQAEILLFRLFYSDPPSIRSLRRNLSEVARFILSL